MKTIYLVSTVIVFIAVACSAGPVDDVAIDGIASIHDTGELIGIQGSVLWILCVDGSVYQVLHWTGEAFRKAEYDPPVPVSDIRYWGARYYIGTDGISWYYSTGSQLWTEFATPDLCGGAVNMESGAMGDLKSSYR